MYPFQRILFPVDYSESCKATVPYVDDMTRRFSAHLTLVHAYSGNELAYGDLPFTYSDVVDAQRIEDERLKKFACETFPSLHAETITKLGEPGRVIGDVVHHQGADLVMLPTHGRGVVRRLLLGSTAAKVLHDIDAAVWTGTNAALGENTLHIPYKSILCAVDQTDEAETIVRAASSFSCALGAHLSLVHVVEMPPMSGDLDFGPYLQDMKDAADFRLREMKERLKIDSPHAILSGEPADAVSWEAARRKADLIVVGRGRANTNVSRIWSHLYQIVRDAPCPVLSI